MALKDTPIINQVTESMGCGLNSVLKILDFLVAINWIGAGIERIEKCAGGNDF